MEDLRERADVERPAWGAGGGADPEPVAAADGQVRRQAAGDRPGDATAGRAAAAGRAQQLAESLWVAQVIAGVVPVEPGDPAQRLAGRGRQTFLLMLFLSAGVEDDRGGVVQGLRELQEFQVVGVSEPEDVVEVVLAGDGGDGAWQRPWRQCLGPVAEQGQPGGVDRFLAAQNRADRRAADQVGQAADHSAGALVQVSGLGGQRAGPFPAWECLFPAGHLRSQPGSPSRRCWRSPSRSCRCRSRDLGPVGAPLRRSRHGWLSP